MSRIAEMMFYANLDGEVEGELWCDIERWLEETRPECEGNAEKNIDIDNYGYLRNTYTVEGKEFLVDTRWVDYEYQTAVQNVTDQRFYVAEHGSREFSEWDASNYHLAICYMLEVLKKISECEFLCYMRE